MPAPILATTIAVEDYSGLKWLSVAGVFQSLGHKLGAHVAIKFPANDFASAEIDDDRKVEPALACWDMRDVASEKTMRLGRGALLFDKIWRWGIGPTITGAGHKCLRLDGVKITFLHESTGALV